MAVTEREPAGRGPRAPAGPPDDAGHLRRDRATWPSASCCRRSTTSRTRARCPERFNLIGVARSRDVGRRVPQDGAGVDQAVLAARARRDRCSTRCSSACATCRARSTTTTCLRAAEARARRVRRGGGDRVQPHLLPRRPRPSSSPLIAEKLGDHELNKHDEARGAHRDREAVRHATSQEALAAQPASALGPRRVAGLPHRPLPGQGDGPEHAGLAVRERHLRADLEPQLHRLRADHRGGGPRDRSARGLLRRGGRAARPGPEPHAPAAEPALHGAAGHVRRPTRCATRR